MPLFFMFWRSLGLTQGFLFCGRGTAVKNFKNYTPEKYRKTDFQEIEDGIYKTKSPYGSRDKDIFVTSLSFEMEPERYGEEDASPRNLTQVPIEGILDEFELFVTDFYEELN